MTPAVSIVIPTLNGMATLPALLDAVDAQDDAEAREVVVVDSGSTDGTPDHARARGARLLTVSRFDHGETRNAGVAAARAPLVVLVVQDARPIGADWLRRLLEPLRSCPRTAGAFARQVPRADAHPAIRMNLERWVASGDRPRVVELDADAFQRLSPAKRLERCAFDNVCAAIRRDVWARHPFRPASIAEDLQWSRDVLLAGYRIVYEPSASVEHSHDRSAWYELARTWVLHQRLHELFGLRAIPTLPALARSLALTMAAHHRLVRRHGAATFSGAWRRAMSLAIAWPLGQYIGGWTAARGLTGWRPGGV
ncbi:MAG TPA: glycosyltransferase [Vicinamibacterales bacterium]